jgi:hypothetical protein
MVRVPTDTDDADAPSWSFSLVILHGGIVVALVVYCAGWI